MVINDPNKKINTIFMALQDDSEYIDDNLRRTFISRERFNEIKHNDDAIFIIETY